MTVALLLSHRGPQGKLRELVPGQAITKVVEVRRSRASKALDDLHAAVLKGEVRMLLADQLHFPGVSTRRLVRELRLWADMGIQVTLADEPSPDPAAAAPLLKLLDDHFEQERVAAIKRGMSAAGCRPGRPRVRVPKEKVVEMYRSGSSLKAIARATGISVSSIGRFLRAVIHAEGEPG